MKWSKSFIYTLKDSPADAEIPSHQLFIRAGIIRKVAQGIFTYGPLGLKAVRHFEKIVRQELESVGCLEVLMPMVQPRELWDETGRYEAMGKDLLKFKNRTEQEWCLGATHEEVITDYVRKDIKSYRNLPVTLFQIQTKYRDEIRPRFGLMRGREFIMKDAYSFDVDAEAAAESYERLRQAYVNIFSRLGLEFRMVQADTGAIGGNKSHEFHVLAEIGEDQLLVSTESDFAANVEICPAQDIIPVLDEVELLPLEAFSTPHIRTIKALSDATGVEENRLVKTMFFSIADDPEKVIPAAVLLRGNDEVNPIKLKNLLGLTNPPPLLTDEEVKEVTGGASPGSCGPVGLKVPIFMDTGVSGLKNYMVGANKDDEHLKNVNHERDFNVTKVADLRMAKEGDRSPDGHGVLKSVRGIEVGHIFYLGTKYSAAMGATYLDANGKSKFIEMGCYGIGIGRTVQAAIEQCHDEDGMIWPYSIAPYQVHICHLDPKDETVNKVAQDIYDQLQACGLEVLMDDRDERPGVKFKDADLLGMPLRITIGGRGVSNNEIEIIERRSKEKKKVAVDEVVKTVSAWAESQK